LDSDRSLDLRPPRGRLRLGSAVPGNYRLSGIRGAGSAPALTFRGAAGADVDATTVVRPRGGRRCSRPLRGRTMLRLFPVPRTRVSRPASWRRRGCPATGRRARSPQTAGPRRGAVWWRRSYLTALWSAVVCRPASCQACTSRASVLWQWRVPAGARGRTSGRLRPARVGRRRGDRASTRPGAVGGEPRHQHPEPSHRSGRLTGPARAFLAFRSTPGEAVAGERRDFKSRVTRAARVKSADNRDCVYFLPSHRSPRPPVRETEGPAQGNPRRAGGRLRRFDGRSYPRTWIYRVAPQRGGVARVARGADQRPVSTLTTLESVPAPCRPYSGCRAAGGAGPTDGAGPEARARRPQLVLLYVWKAWTREAISEITGLKREMSRSRSTAHKERSRPLLRIGRPTKESPMTEDPSRRCADIWQREAVAALRLDVADRRAEGRRAPRSAGPGRP
jgi:hypothetical protein